MAEDAKQKVVEALELLPRDKLQEIYDLIHPYRLGFEQGGSRRSQILQLAGSWSAMADEEFTAFLEY